MAQNVHIIDLRRSYLPLPPDAMPVTMHDTQAEDQPEARIPVIPYDGYNFMPTPQGYCSFFGINSHVDITTLYYLATIPAVPAGYDYHATVAEADHFLAVDQGYSTFAAFLADNGLPDEAALLAYYNSILDPDVGSIAEYNWRFNYGTWISQFGERTLTAGSAEVPGHDGTQGDVDDVFIIQTTEFVNILVALCSDGIFIAHPNAPNAWEHVVTLAIPATPELHRHWSKCVIDNIVYVYRQGEAHIWEVSPATGYIWTEKTPTGINMAGQLGIFKAGGRLAFWDSENSTGWSSLIDPLAFGDAEQLSGFTIFQDIVGRIVVVLQHGDGFIIYATKSIVWVRRNVASQMLFAGQSIYNNNGISYRGEAVYADPDTTHFAMTTQGLVEISSGVAQVVMPEISTYFKEKRIPMFLKVLNGRYLTFCFLDPYYALGRANFHSELVAGSVYSWAKLTKAVTDWNAGNGVLPCRALLGVDSNMQNYYLNSQYGFTKNTQATTPNSIPVWEDHLCSLVAIANINAWKNTGPSGFGSNTYFNTFNTGLAVNINAGNTYLLPAGMPLAADAPTIHVEDNQQNFYSKQDFIWYAEDRYAEDWKYAAEHHVTAPVVKDLHYTYRPITDIPSDDITHTPGGFTFGPYPDFSFLSEANKYYGVAEKSAWLQRSLTQTFKVKIEDIIRTTYKSPHIMQWAVPGGGVGPNTFPQHVYANYATALANGPTDFVASLNAYEAANGGGFYGPPAHYVLNTVYAFGSGRCGSGSSTVAFMYRGDGTGGSANPAFDCDRTAIIYMIDPDNLESVDVYGNDLKNLPTITVGGDVVRYNKVQTQTFQIPKYETQIIDTCVIKELGFTKIKGHGNYNLDGSFTAGNNTPEAADYIDQCDLTPKKKKRPQFNGFSIGEPWSNGQLCGHPSAVSINGVNWDYPQLDPVVLPSTTIFLEDGSIEPLYPTFLGAFVYDIQYKKWGKCVEDYKLLLDFFPVNNIAGANPIPYDTFLPRMAALKDDGLVYVFDQYPDNSQLVLGKYGDYRKGFTDLQEVRLQHRTPMTGHVVVEASLNGRDIEPSLTVVKPYTATRQFSGSENGGYGLSARWYNIIVEDHYDLIELEVRSTKAGRR